MTYTLNAATQQLQTVKQVGSYESGRVSYQTSGNGYVSTTSSNLISSWSPRDDLLYVWVEGQEKTEVIKKKYEKRAFDFGLFEWDGIIADGDYEWKNSEFRDASPLLESEVVTAPGDDDYLSYAQNQAYTVAAVTKTDFAVRINPGDKIFVTPPDADNTAFYQEKTGEPIPVPSSEFTYKQYRYIGENTIDVLLAEVNYGDTDNWQLIKDYNTSSNSNNFFANLFNFSGLQMYADMPDEDSINQNGVYRSDYMNRFATNKQWETGGGYMKKKTYHTLNTETLGLKDYYTHTLAADADVTVDFSRPTGSQNINITSRGDVIFEKSFTLGGTGATASIRSISGDIIGQDQAGVLGAEALTLTANSGRIEFAIQGQGSAGTFSATASGDIDVKNLVVNNVSNPITVDQVVSQSGDVTIDFGGGVLAEDSGSLIKGDTVQISAGGGSIGSDSQAIRIDTDGSVGGLRAGAGGSIFLYEIDASGSADDLRLLNPIFGYEASVHAQAVETTATASSTGTTLSVQDASDVVVGQYLSVNGAMSTIKATAVNSTTNEITLSSAQTVSSGDTIRFEGEIQVEVEAGALVDAYLETFDPISAAQAASQGEALGVTGALADELVDARANAQEMTDTASYHSYWGDYRQVEQSTDYSVTNAVTNGTTIVLDSIANLKAGDLVSGDGIAAGTTIQSIDSGQSSISLSQSIASGISAGAVLTIQRPSVTIGDTNLVSENVDLSAALSGDQWDTLSVDFDQDSYAVVNIAVGDTVKDSNGVFYEATSARTGLIINGLDLSDVGSDVTATAVAQGSASTTLAVDDATNIFVSQMVSGTNIATGTFVTAVDLSTDTVTLSTSTTSAMAGTETITFAAGWDVVDPDYNVEERMQVTLEAGDIVSVPDVEVSQNQIIVDKDGGLLRYTGTDTERFFLPLVTASLSDWDAVSSSGVPSSATGAVEGATVYNEHSDDLADGDLAYNSTTQKYYQYSGAGFTGDWIMPSETGSLVDDNGASQSGHSWTEVADARTLPTQSTRYVATGASIPTDLITVESYSAHASFTKEVIATSDDLTKKSIIATVSDGDYLRSTGNDLYQYVAPDVSVDTTFDVVVETSFDVTVNGEVTSGSDIVLDDASSVSVGDLITGTGIATGTTISSISSNTITLSAAVASTVSDDATLTIAPAVASGSTTIVFASVDGISTGDAISGEGLATGTTVQAIDSGTKTVTLSQATTASIANASELQVSPDVASGETDVELASVAGIVVGDAVSGTGIAASTTVTAIDTTTKTITLSNATTAALSDGAGLTLTRADLTDFDSSTITADSEGWVAVSVAHNLETTNEAISVADGDYLIGHDGSVYLAGSSAAASITLLTDLSSATGFTVQSKTSYSDGASLSANDVFDAGGSSSNDVLVSLISQTASDSDVSGGASPDASLTEGSQKTTQDLSTDDVVQLGTVQYQYTGPDSTVDLRAVSDDLLLQGSFDQYEILKDSDGRLMQYIGSSSSGTLSLRDVDVTAATPSTNWVRVYDLSEAVETSNVLNSSDATTAAITKSDLYKVTDAQDNVTYYVAKQSIASGTSSADVTNTTYWSEVLESGSLGGNVADGGYVIDSGDLYVNESGSAQAFDASSSNWRLISTMSVSDAELLSPTASGYGDLDSHAEISQGRVVAFDGTYFSLLGSTIAASDDTVANPTDGSTWSEVGRNYNQWSVVTGETADVTIDDVDVSISDFVRVGDTYYKAKTAQNNVVFVHEDFSNTTNWEAAYSVVSTDLQALRQGDLSTGDWVQDIDRDITLTTAASSGDTTISINSTVAAKLTLGATVSGTGVAVGSVITAISGGTVTLSQATTGAVSAVSVTGGLFRYAGSDASAQDLYVENLKDTTEYDEADFYTNDDGHQTLSAGSVELYDATNLSNYSTRTVSQNDLIKTIDGDVYKYLGSSDATIDFSQTIAASGNTGETTDATVVVTIDGAVASGSELTLDSITGIAVGNTVIGTNIVDGTTITAISGLTVTLSNAVSGAIADDAELSITDGTTFPAVSEGQVVFNKSNQTYFKVTNSSGLAAGWTMPSVADGSDWVADDTDAAEYDLTNALVTSDIVVTGTGAQTTSVAVGDLVKNSAVGKYFIALDAQTSSWTMPTSAGSSWVEYVPTWEQMVAEADAGALESTSKLVSIGFDVESGGERYVFKTGIATVDLLTTDYTNTSVWTAKTADFDVSDLADVTVNNGDYVTATDGTLFKFVETSATLDLASTNLATDVRFAKTFATAPDHDLTALVTQSVTSSTVVAALNNEGVVTRFAYEGEAATLNLLEQTFDGSSLWSETTSAATIDLNDIAEFSVTSADVVLWNGTYYEYKASSATVDFMQADFTDQTVWLETTPVSGFDVSKLGVDTTQTIQTGDLVLKNGTWNVLTDDNLLSSVSHGFTDNGTIVNVVPTIGTVSEEDFSNTRRWAELTADYDVEALDADWDVAGDSLSTVTIDNGDTVIDNSGNWWRFDGSDGSSRDLSLVATYSSANGFAQVTNTQVIEAGVVTLETGDLIKNGNNWYRYTSSTSQTLDLTGRASGTADIDFSANYLEEAHDHLMGSSRVDAEQGMIVKKNDKLYELISDRTGINNLDANRQYFVVVEDADSIRLTDDRITAMFADNDATVTPNFSNDVVDVEYLDISVTSGYSGENYMFALREPTTYTADSGQQAITAFDDATDSFTLASGHGLQTGQVIYIANAGDSSLEVGGNALTSQDYYFALVDGDSLKLARTAQDASDWAAASGNARAAFEENITGSLNGAALAAMTDYQLVIAHETYGGAGQSYDVNKKVVVDTATRLAQKEARKVDVSSLQYPLNGTLYDFLFPHADQLADAAIGGLSESANLQGAHVKIEADQKIGEVAEARQLILTGGFSTISTTDQEALSLASPDEIGQRVAYQRFVYVGNGYTDSTSSAAENIDLTHADFVQITPDVITSTAATVSTTTTAAASSDETIEVASSSDIVVGQTLFVGGTSAEVTVKDVSGTTVTLSDTVTISSGTAISFAEIREIETGDRVLFRHSGIDQIYVYEGTDGEINLSTTSVSDANLWSVLNETDHGYDGDHRTYLTNVDRTANQSVTLSTGDQVLVQYTSLEYGYYEYVATATDATVNLKSQDFSDDMLWTRLDSAITTETSGAIALSDGDIVSNHRRIDLLVLHQQGDVNLETTGGVELVGGDDVAVEGLGGLRMAKALAAGDMYLRASDLTVGQSTIEGDITVTSSGSALTGTTNGEQVGFLGTNNVFLVAEGSIGNSLTDPLDIAMSAAGILYASADGDIFINQVDDDFTYEGANVNTGTLKVEQLSTTSLGSHSFLQNEAGSIQLGLSKTQGDLTLQTAYDLTDLSSDDSGARVVDISSLGLINLQIGGDVGTSSDRIEISTTSNTQTHGVLSGDIGGDLYIASMDTAVYVHDLVVTGDANILALTDILDGEDPSTDTIERQADGTGFDLKASTITITLDQDASVGAMNNYVEIDSTSTTDGLRITTVSSDSDAENSVSIAELYGDLLIDGIHTGASGFANLRSNASILEQKRSGNTDTNIITGDLLRLYSGSEAAGIGGIVTLGDIGTSSQAIMTAVSRLERVNARGDGDSGAVGADGSVWLQNTGDLTAGNDDQNSAYFAATGDFTMTTMSPIFIKGVQAIDGDYIVTATEDNSDGTTSTDDVITVMSGAQLTVSGNLDFDAGDGVTIEGDASISVTGDFTTDLEYADETIDSTAGTVLWGDPDVGDQSTISAANIYVNASDSGDSLTFRNLKIDVGSGDFEIRGGDESDTITFAEMRVIGDTTITGGGETDQITVMHLQSYDSDYTFTIDGGAARDTVDVYTTDLDLRDYSSESDDIGYTTSGLSNDGLLRTNYEINVTDSGGLFDGADVLTIHGRGYDNEPGDPINSSALGISGTDSATNQDDVMLVRSGYVARLHADLNDGSNRDQFEKINYDDSINGRLIVKTHDGDDSIIMDDNAVSTTLDLGEGDDFIQVGQVYGLADGFNPATDAPSYDSSTGSGTFDPGSGPLVGTYISLYGEVNFLSAGVSEAAVIYGGEGDDTFKIYSNKAEMRLEGEAGDDEFLIRAFVAAGELLVNAGGGDDNVQYNINAPVDVDGGSGSDSVVALGTEANDVFAVTEDGIFGAGLNISAKNVESIEVDGLEGDDTIYLLSTKRDVVTRLIGGYGSDEFIIRGDVVETVVSKNNEGFFANVNHTVTSNDAAFNQIAAPSQQFIVLDEDTSPITISESGGLSRLVEGLVQDTYTIQMAAIASALAVGTKVNVNVSAAQSSSADRRASSTANSALISLDGGTNWVESGVVQFVVYDNGGTNAFKYTVDGSTLTVGSSFTVHMKAPDDSATEGDREAIIGHTIDVDTSGLTLTPAQQTKVDELSAFKLRDVKPIVIDDETGAILLTRTNLENRVTEGGASDTFEIQLLTQPTADVTITMTTDDQISTSASSLTFTSSNWNTAQTVTLSATDDSVSEMIWVSHVDFTVSSTDTLYGNATLGSERVYVQDNDRASLIVETIDGDARVTNGVIPAGDITDTYRVKLSRQPTADVTIALSPADQITTDVSTLTFTSTNWDTFQTITVSPTGVAPGSALIEKPFELSDHDLSPIRGPVVIEGGTTESDRSIIAAISIPTEAVLAPSQPTEDFNEANETDRLRVYSDSRTSDDTGVVTTSNLSGFGMGADDLLGGGGITYDDGISYRGVDFIELLGGSGDDQISVDLDLLKESRQLTTGTRSLDGQTLTTVTLTTGSWWLNDFRVGDEVFLMNGSTQVSTAFVKEISTEGDILTLDSQVSTTGVDAVWRQSALTVIHGGGGDDTITLTGGDSRDISNFVIFGDTSQDGARYTSTSGVPENLAYPFINGGSDTINGSAATSGIVAFGGVGSDTISANGGASMLYGGSGDDVLSVDQGSTVRLYGDAGLNLAGDARTSTNSDIFALVYEEASSTLSGSGDGIAMGADTLSVAAGNSLIVGDLAEVTFSDETTGGTTHDWYQSQSPIMSLQTIDTDLGPTQTADTITTGSGGDIVIGGMGADTIHASVGGQDLLIGDTVTMDRPEISLRVTVENRIGHADVFVGPLTTSTAIGGPGVDTMELDGYNVVQDFGSVWISGSLEDFEVTNFSPESEARAAEADEDFALLKQKKIAEVETESRRDVSRPTFKLNLVSTKLIPIEARILGDLPAVETRAETPERVNILEKTQKESSRSLATMLNRQANLGARESLIPESVNAGETPQVVSPVEAVENVNDLVPELAIDPEVLEALTAEETDTSVGVPDPELNLEDVPGEEAEQETDGEQTNEAIPDVPPPVTPSNVVDQLLGQAESGGPDNGRDSNTNPDESERDLEVSDQQGVSAKNPGLQSLAKNLGWKFSEDV